MFWIIVLAILGVVLLAALIHDRKRKGSVVDPDNARESIAKTQGEVVNYSRPNGMNGGGMGAGF